MLYCFMLQLTFFQKNKAMQDKIIYLARHAKPLLPDDKKRYLGQSDPPLSPEGMDQAERLANTLARFSVSEIFSSDLTRAVQTASIVAAAFGLKVKTDEKLREINMGKWENLTFEEVQTRYPEDFEKRGNDIVYFRPSEGESYFDLQVRALDAFYAIVKNSIGNTVIVGHAGVNRAILCVLMSLPLQDIFSIQQDYAFAYEITVKGGTMAVTGTIAV